MNQIQKEIYNQGNVKEQRHIPFFPILFFVVIIVLLSSCSTTRKIKSVVKSTTDSSSVVKIDSNITRTIDSTTVKKDNTVTTTETEDDYKKEIIIEFDTSFKWVDTSNTQPKRSGWVVADDYFPPIKKITIRETGVKKEKTVTVANKIDSTTIAKKETVDLTKSVNTETHKTTIEKNKEVKRTSYWGWLWIGLICLACAVVFAFGWYYGWYYGWWRWLFALFKRKNKDEYPVKYTNYQPPKPPVT